uniref:Ig kappa chain V-III region PC 2154 isoform X2 n=1 Tax=Monopterus albus TaxID=43700 RepID=UPI003D7D7FA4
MSTQTAGFWGQYPAAALPASTVQVRVGENATLHCPLLDNSTSTAPTLNASSTLSWYRKVAGQSPELLLTVRSTDPSSVTYGSSVGPGKALAGANGSLLLHNSQHSDTAVYYCGISWGDQHKKPVPQQVTEK